METSSISECSLTLSVQQSALPTDTVIRLVFSLEEGHALKEVDGIVPEIHIEFLPVYTPHPLSHIYLLVWVYSIVFWGFKSLIIPCNG